MLQRCANGILSLFATPPNKSALIYCSSCVEWQQGLLKPFLKCHCPGGHIAYLPHHPPKGLQFGVVQHALQDLLGRRCQTGSNLPSGGLEEYVPGPLEPTGVEDNYHLCLILHDLCPLEEGSGERHSDTDSPIRDRASEAVSTGWSV